MFETDMNQPLATVSQPGGLGMISLRVKPGEGVEALIGSGFAAPGKRRIDLSGRRAVAWMSPDEYLLILPHEDLQTTLADLSGALVGTHHLAVDLSDARAIFDLSGPAATEVLSKLMPVDFETLAEDEVRRSRHGQVAAAVWRQNGGYRLMCFRSVARYVADLVDHSARPGSGF